MKSPNNRPSDGAVVLAAGGSGGHIFPAIGLVEELKRRDPSRRTVYLCGTKDIESRILREAPGDGMHSIESSPYRGAASLTDGRFLGALWNGYRTALRLLRAERPSVVVGFGGYYSFPAVLAARTLGLPTVLHEQNVAPGRANRTLARWVDVVAVSDADSIRAFRGARRIVHTGNPIRGSIERDCRQEALRSFGFDPARKTLLVLGGSQGAESINTIFAQALRILDESTRARVQTLHLCGRMDPGESEALCRDLGVPAKAYSFFDRMDLAYAAADVALGRAGATFLSEIAEKEIPAILVPYPHGDGHQRWNAKVFAGRYGAEVVEQAELTPERAADLLGRALRGESEVRGRASGEGAQARRRLADLVLEVAAGYKGKQR
ncbi:MAG: UDP-N-acetylglucosamine--N-acetylmuramyl-(pentapeptide) pyrophosphoryl-undecaprenol N-acetylglucosamine transferase [Candidatus Omnitrophica bacterium]|nr:UDP-N-acetylglucosamine--N-acetylmuramyl-(pentapeptide) pyrophosphoryl-undecaprenol N-acetylglucosamine transferase [Candidatus Omnitrophota bacterium]